MCNLRRAYVVLGRVFGVTEKLEGKRKVIGYKKSVKKIVIFHRLFGISEIIHNQRKHWEIPY